MSEQPSQNKPAPELSADLFLRTALRLAEQSGGAQKLSLRNLGKALNVDPTAVYRYFPSKAAMVDAMMKRLGYDFLPDEAEMQGDWRARLTALARRAYTVFSTYPSLSIHLPSSPYIRTEISDQLTELAYEALKEAGLHDEHVVVFHEVLYTLALGIGQVDAQFDEDLENEKRMMREHIATISPETFPNVHRMAPLMVVQSEAVFQLTLEMYLNAVESYASGSTG
ncbi:MAG: TetR/AcrR family transcriptional regulator [Chloroflexota bacterium]